MAINSALRTDPTTAAFVRAMAIKLKVFSEKTVEIPGFLLELVAQLPESLQAERQAMLDAAQVLDDIAPIIGHALGAVQKIEASLVQEKAGEATNNPGEF
jgi:hypothetical protein